MRGKKRFTLTVCSSASFYKQVIGLSYDIEQFGIEVILPSTAENMKRKNGQNSEAVIDWPNSTTGYHGKSLLIREHFAAIYESDAILVANYMKHGKPDYIGPNVLMEMAVAFFLHKKIFILHDKPDDSPLIDEILGLKPVFLNSDITKLKQFCN